MKLALIGYGKMGRLVEEVARERGHEVVARFTAGRPLGAGDDAHAELAAAPVLVDFSLGDAVPATVRAAAELGCNLAIGTTGWDDRRDEVREWVEEAGIGVVHGANFSLGVNLFYLVVERAARVFAPFAEYDPFLEEAHHKAKVDRPSGTARQLQELLAGAYGEREIPTAVLRAGHIPGSHAVGFDSVADTVRLEHVARGRRGFAEGALLAAGWIAGRSGFYSFRDVLDDVFPANDGRRNDE